MFDDLSGRVALVTGASRGLGRHLCNFLSDKGVKIVGTARNEEELNSLKEELKAKGRDAMVFPMDISDYDAIKKMVDVVVKEFGKIDILINNAGLKAHIPIEEIDQAQIDLELDTILKGTIYATRHVAPVMMKAKQGAIINITSTSALRGINSNGIYFAAKHGQRGFGDSMSKYLAPYNIHVVTLCPGGMDTHFWDNIEHTIHDSADQLMKVEEISELIELILKGAKNTLFKQITFFPISEAELW
jgi:NAD(P)-dependent dehydrogenase (short-subunit alcohol dehydrogenase family)